MHSHSSLRCPRLSLGHVRYSEMKTGTLMSRSLGMKSRMLLRGRFYMVTVANDGAYQNRAAGERALLPQPSMWYG